MRAGTTINKFIHGDGRTYAELGDGDSVLRVLTEHATRFSATAVLKADVLELLELSFGDPDKQGNLWTIALRRSDALPSALMSERFVEDLKGDFTGVDEWKRSVLAPRRERPAVRMSLLVLTDSDPVTGDGDVTLGEEFAEMRIKDLFCSCKPGTFSVAHCLNSALRCAMNNLCDAWDCVESGEWTPECSQNLEMARVCLGEYQS